MAHANATDSIVVFGCNDDQTTCDHCGRTDLKATVALSIDDGPILRFGRGCAATALKVGKASINRAIREVEKAEKLEARRASEARMKAESDAWDAFLLERTGCTEKLEAFERLGGFAAARAAFREATGRTS